MGQALKSSHGLLSVRLLLHLTFDLSLFKRALIQNNGLQATLNCATARYSTAICKRQPPSASMETNTECVKVSYGIPDLLDTHTHARTHMHARRGGEGCNHIVHINDRAVFWVLAGEAA